MRADLEVYKVSDNSGNRELLTARKSDGMLARPSDVASKRPLTRVWGFLLRYAPAFVLVVLTLALSTRKIGEGGFRYQDCSTHAMDGVFVHDFVADMPDSLSNPLEYSMQYYAQYPGLGILLYYPPFFATVEAVFFAFFGVSVLTARLTVVMFALVGVLMMYNLVAHIGGKRAAFLSACLFVSLPTVVFWSRQVMLEIPTVAMILTACCFFYRYAEVGHRRSAIWTGVFATVAVMTKQQALFIIPAFALYLVVRRRWDAFKHWQLWVGVAVMVVVLVPYFILEFHYAHLLTSAGNTAVSRGVGTALGEVLGAWSEGLSLPLLIAVVVAGAGILIHEAVDARQPGVWLVGLLGVMFLAESVYLRLAEARYAIMGFPFLVCLIPLALERAKLLRHRAIMTATAALVLALAGVSYMQPVRAVHGYAEAADAIVRANGDSPFVLVDGFRDSDFAFHIRQKDPARRLYVLRGSKMLYAYASLKSHGYREFITTSEDLAQFMRDYGIRIVAIEDKDLEDTAPGALLRTSLMNQDAFHLVGSFPIRAHGTRLDGLNILVFESRQPAGPPTAQSLTIPLVGLQRTIHVPLKQPGRTRITYTPWGNR